MAASVSQNAAPAQIAPLGLPGFPNFPAKAKRVIYLFQSGAPSQMDMFDYKPKLVDLRGTDLPDSVRNGQRLTGMSSGQKNFPVAPSMFKFKQYGNSGAWMSDLLPYTSQIADELCIIKSLYTEAINHDPAVTFFQSGSQIAGRPAIGSWFSYGLGSENKDLPAYVVLISRGKGNAQPLADRDWGRGLFADATSGREIQRVGRAGALSERPRRCGSVAPPRHARPAQRFKQHPSRCRRRSRGGNPHLAI